MAAQCQLVTTVPEDSHELPVDLCNVVLHSVREERPVETLPKSCRGCLPYAVCCIC